MTEATLRLYDEICESLGRYEAGFNDPEAARDAISRALKEAREAAILEERTACKQIVSQSTQYAMTGDLQTDHLGNLINREIDRRGQS